MIAVIEGRGVGSGKSYNVLRQLMPHWVRGGTACVSDTVEIKWDECKAYARDRAGVVLEDDQYRAISSTDLQRLHEVTPPGSSELPVKIVVDEAQDAFNARDWSDKGKRPFFSWLCQSRHDDNDVIIISQAAANVDKQIRRLCTFIYVTRNTENFPVLGANLSQWIRLLTFGLHCGQMFVINQMDQDGRTCLNREWHTADRGLFKCYESKAMRLKHRRAGEAVARKKLQRVKRRGNPVLKFAMVPLVALAIWGGMKLAFAGGKSPAQKSAPVGRASGYELKVATYLFGADDRVLSTVEFGNLELGEMCDLGMVESIRGHRARVKSPSGKLIFVVASKSRTLEAAK